MVRLWNFSWGDN